MKKKILVLALAITTNCGYTQNIFPTSGNVGVGTTSPTTDIDIQKVGSSGSAPAITISGYQNNSNSSAYLGFKKSRGMAIGSLVTTQDNDALGVIDFYGVNTNTIPGSVMSARIIAYQDSAAGPAFNAGRLQFFTGTSQNLPKVKMTILSGGNVGIGTVNPKALLHTFGVGEQLRLGYDAAHYVSFNANSAGQLTIAPTGSALFVSSGVAVNTDYIPSGYKFAVNGSVIATSVTVKVRDTWPDYVFNRDYKLPALINIKNYIDKNQHLPEMPSADEVRAGGLNLGEMNRLLTKKIEELTLYLIEKDKQIIRQEKQLMRQQTKNEQQEVRIAALEKALSSLTSK